MGSPEIKDDGQKKSSGDVAVNAAEESRDAAAGKPASKESTKKKNAPEISLHSRETVSGKMDETYRDFPQSETMAEETIFPTAPKPSSMNPAATLSPESQDIAAANSLKAAESDATGITVKVDGAITDGTLETISPEEGGPNHSVTDAKDGTLDTIAPDAGETVRSGAVIKPEVTVKSGAAISGQTSKTLDTVDPQVGLQTGFETMDGEATSDQSDDNLPPVRLIGDYEILSELGRGGMGVVYKARHRTLRRVVALKMILSGGHNSKKTLDRFLSEARAVAHLQHPGIVQIFDIGEHDGLPYFSLEFVEGRDLQQDLNGRPTSAQHAAKMVEAVCRAMHYAHENGILHRDLKPANILLNADNEAKITDFGLAKEVDSENSGETTVGTVMGSPSYMPPEQARGDINAISDKSDQYSLGAVLYQMLTARPPFLSDRPFDTVMQVINNEAVDPRELQASIPIDLETICMKALQKDQESRYEDCEQMADDLRRFLNGEPILARPVSRAVRAFRWCRRNPKIAIPSGVAGVFVGFTAVIASWAWVVTAAQAQVITIEKEKVVEQRDEAQKQTIIADEARLLAVANEELARQQKEEADKQRAIALAQKQQAEQNEALAKRQADLALRNIQYVITDVDKRLKAKPGMNDLRIAMLEAASDKWNELDVEMTGGLRGEAIPTLMALRQQIAVAFTELDRLEEADNEFEKLFALGQERVDLKGNDAARTNQAKIAMAWAPVRRRVDSSPEKAMDLLNSAIGLVQETLSNPKPEEGSPSENDIRELLAVLQQNLGVEFLEQGQLAETAKQFESALKNMATVLEAIRSAKGYDKLDENQKDTLTAMKQISHDKSAVGLAYILMRQGQTKRSIELYNTAIAGRREIFDRRQTMLPLKVELAGYLGNYGQSLLWIDDLSGAEPLLEESLKLSLQILENDPEKASYKRSVTTAQYRMGSLRDLQGNHVADAASLFEACRGLRAELNEASADQKNQVNLMLASARAGDLDEARKLVDRLGESEEKNGELHLERARALTQMSRHAAESEREDLLLEAVSAAKRAVKEGYGDPFRVNAEPDLRLLRERDEFQQILSDMRAE